MLTELRIKTSIDFVEKLGWHIKPDHTIVVNDKCCCPIGAIFIAECGVPSIDMYMQDVVEEINIDLKEAENFASGFDLDDRYVDNRAAFKLGKKIRYERDNQVSP